eukprot:TRINITY_DN2793_c0_g1_i1.p1 TRINITY_DN2793_c0_g1~~TRINITY_DN2793_c0_g1_i1.p1  ORF type:complete len:401 (+),score=116.11 TRINITY_DN2793_c0_g1_i1:382-1584(+)
MRCAEEGGGSTVPAGGSDPMSRRRAVISASGDLVPPRTLFELYNFSEPKPFAAKTAQAVFEYDEYWFASDISSFQRNLVPNIAGQTVQRLIGTNNTGGVHTAEATLDIQYLMAFGQFVPVWAYSYQNMQEGTFLPTLTKWLSDLSSSKTPPAVQSLSYGAYGGDYPAGYVEQLDTEFMKLGVRGVTVVVASGDEGTGCSADCKSFDTPLPTSPHALLVGSTDCPSEASPSAAIRGSQFSTGGFSGVWPQPSYQASVVSEYLKTPSLPKSLFNSSGRAYPDVSACGRNVEIISGGGAVGGTGTSISAPQIAGMLSAVNELRAAAGRPALGFVNPLLYKAYADVPGAFIDIVGGENNRGNQDCGESTPCNGKVGFAAVKGFDAITGLGHPNFGLLRDYLVAN